MKTLKKSFLLLLFIVIGTSGIYGQGKITGTVTDVSNGRPIIGANVIIDGTSVGLLLK